MKRCVITLLICLAVLGCGVQTETEPGISFKSENIISLASHGKISPSAKIYDMAINHCKSYGLYANYKSLDAGLWGPATYTFTCEKKKADDALVIAAIKQGRANRDSQLTKNLALANLGLAISNPAPARIQTTCTTFRNTTTCR